MAHRSKKKNRDSSDSDDSYDSSDDDTDSSEEEFDGQMEKICAEFGGLGNFKATDAGPSSRKGGAKTQGSNLQSVKGAKGRHDNEYWRNLSKLKKVAQSAPGEKEKRKDRKDRKRREKAEKKKDPQLLPSVFVSPSNISCIETLIRAYRATKPKAEKSVKKSHSDRDTGNHRLQAADPESLELMDRGDHETEEWQDILDGSDDVQEPARVLTDQALIRMDSLSLQYMDELAKKQSDPAYREILQFRKKLPAYAAKSHLLQVIKENQICVVSGETGCGKTTQLPQFLLDDWIERGEGSRCTIVCTQPRRISAISVAERIAKERAENLGVSVGYQIRLEKKLPRDHCSILMCTTGVLLQWLTSNSKLHGISHIIVDEIHEQDILSDFLLIILKDICRSRSDLKIILMSATINAEKFSEYFGGSPLVNIPGYTFPVKVLYLEEVLTAIDYRPKVQNGKAAPKKIQRERDYQWDQFLSSLKGKHPAHVQETLKYFDESVIDFDLVYALVRHIDANTPAKEAILVFLPGWDDIKKLNNMLDGGLKRNDTLIIPLHSMMPTINQRQVFERPVNKRKIVIATSIAETSITIDDIVHVIDCGKIKMKDFDVERNLSTLTAQWVSVSNAKQRKGRAGRVKSGMCYHLFTSYQLSKLLVYPLPEMRRTRLDELCLQLKLLNLGRVAPFLQKAMEPPSPQAVTQAVNLLNLIGALDENEQLTPLGKLLARTPVPPQIGKMMFLGCIFRCVSPILHIAGVLSYRDPFCTPLGREDEARRAREAFIAGTKSDHIMYHDVIEDYLNVVVRRREETPSQYCWERYMFPSTLQQILKMKDQFARILHSCGFLNTMNPNEESSNANSNQNEIIRAVVCAGLYPNLGLMKRAKGLGTSVRTQSEDKLSVHPKSQYGRKCEDSGVVAFFSVVQTSKIYIHDITLLTTNVPAALFSKSITTTKSNHVDILCMDGWLQFRCPQSSAKSLIEFRKVLEEIFADIYENSLREGAVAQEAKALLLEAEKLFKFKTTA